MIQREWCAVDVLLALDALEAEAILKMPDKQPKQSSRTRSKPRPSFRPDAPEREEEWERPVSVPPPGRFPADAGFTRVEKP